MNNKCDESIVSIVSVIEACARAAHEVNRAYCAALGDHSQASWADAPEWQKTSARNGVRSALGGNTPAQSHASWLAEKDAAGWVYGPVKDHVKKTHPCMVPYDDLPPEQRVKDSLFVAVVRQVWLSMAMVGGGGVKWRA